VFRDDRGRGSERDGLLVTAYALAGTVLAHIAVSEPDGNAVAYFGLLGLALLLGALTRARYVVWAPFIPWSIITLAVAVAGATGGWQDLWFFNLILWACASAVAIMATRRARDRMFRRRSE
jgi:O-antigen/teichoic acid export membrane protein